VLFPNFGEYSMFPREILRVGVEFQIKIYKTLRGKATTLHALLYMFLVGQTT